LVTAFISPKDAQVILKLEGFEVEIKAATSRSTPNLVRHSFQIDNYKPL
jgi:hypothetical protein